MTEKEQNAEKKRGGERKRISTKWRKKRSKGSRLCTGKSEEKRKREADR